MGLSDEELLYRLGGLYSKNQVALVRKEIEEARAMMEGVVVDFEGDIGSANTAGRDQRKLSGEELERLQAKGARRLAEIHGRYGYRMHSLSEFF